jgi:FkbM family methyltransferase
VGKLLERRGWQVQHLAAGQRRGGVRINWRPDRANVMRGAVVQFLIDDVPFRFFVEDDFDVIQAHHHNGRIYEEEELAIIARHYPGGTFVDVGGNVGNHAVYAAKALNAPRVIVFEPERLAAQICEINAALNGCEGRIVLHRRALARIPGRANPSYLEHNLGGTRMEPTEDGVIEMVRGDDILRNEDPKFIKIDTEGFELQALEGLDETIERCRPTLFVEVENEHIEAFNCFCTSHGYEIIEEFRRYQLCTNFLAVPR